VVAVIEGLYLRVKIAALTAALTLVFACAAAADPDPPITDEEIIA
jgi:hypothetical protein